jgi:methylenetetrahydrofolate reductase (NADPH)
MGGQVLVHLSCRDRSRASLESLAFGLASEGLTDVLALSGDYPREGFGGLSRPVFDIDSVALLALLAHVGTTGSTFHAGCVVNPFKSVRRDLLPQLLKLALKVRAGARFVITQVGWDARSWHELVRWTQREGLDVPLIAAVYVLGPGVARAFHADRVPGIRLGDGLRAIVEREAASPDRGRAWSLELAAMQVAVARHLGFAGVYLAGAHGAEEVARVLATSEAYDASDLPALAAEVSFPEPGAARLFEPAEHPHLASDRPAATPRPRRRAPLAYRVNRMVHEHLFEPSSPGFALGRAVYRRVETEHLSRPLHVLEQAVKIPMFGCHDCGDCSLPDIAYLCPESQCVKNQRNGPCGGSLAGECEVPGKPCIWAAAWERLEPFGEARTMLDRPPVLQDNALRGTSAWANAFLGRDHRGRTQAEAPTSSIAPAPGAEKDGGP